MSRDELARIAAQLSADLFRQMCAAEYERGADARPGEAMAQHAWDLSNEWISHALALRDMVGV